MKQVLVAVEAVSAGSKPPAAVSVRISADERHGFGITAPLCTRASPCNKGEPEVRWSHPRSWSDTSTGRHRASSVPLRVFVSGFTSASVARRGCRASCSRPAKRCLVHLIFSVRSSKFHPVDRNGSPLILAVYRIFLQKVDTCSSKRVDQTQIHYVGKRGHCPRRRPYPASVAS